MAMTVELSCAMCTKNKQVELDTFHLPASTTVADVVKKAGWISQQNGENFDIYCSKRCAA